MNKRKTLQARSRLVRLADTPVSNFIKVKSTEKTSLSRQYSFIDFWHFLASDAKVGGPMGLSLQRHLTLTELKIDLWLTNNIVYAIFEIV